MEAEPRRSFGDQLRSLRKHAGWTQQDLADRAELDRATISLIENDRENPRTDTVLRLARVLQVSPAELYASERPDKGLHETAEPHYEPEHSGELHPGLRELLDDSRTRLMLGLTPDEEAMLRSIRTRQDAPLGKDFFLDVLISFRRHR